MPRTQHLTAVEARADFVLLLHIEVAGVVYRFATRKVAVETADGDTYLYAGGLDLEHDQALDLFEVGSEEAVPIRGLIFPDDIGELINQGHAFDDVPAELSLWVPGRTYEERIVLVAGRTWLPDYGERFEPVDLSLEARIVESTERFPPPEARITAATWASAPDDSLGKYYPTVIGKPGFALGGSANGTNGGSPAWLVHDSNYYVLVADGWTYQDSTDQVRLINKTKKAAATLSLIRGVDGLNRKVTYVDASTEFGATWEVGDELWGRWDAVDGGLAGETGLLHGLGDVAVHLLRNAGVDRAAWRAVAPFLNRFKIDTYLDDPIISPEEWVQRHLVPLAPLSLVRTRNGLAPIVWRHDATKNDAVDEITVSPGLTRVGPVQLERPVYNQWRGEYAPRSDGGDPSGHLVLTGDASRVTADQDIVIAGILQSAFAAARNIVREGNPFTTTATFDRNTMMLALLWRAFAYAFPRQRLTLADLYGKHLHRKLGDIVLVNESSVGWSQRVAIVERMSWAGLPMIGLLLHHRHGYARAA